MNYKRHLSDFDCTKTDLLKNSTNNLNGEDHIDNDDLDKHTRERRSHFRRGTAFFPFKQLMHLVRALVKQEQSATNEYQIATGDLLCKHGEQRFNQTDDHREH